MFSSNQVLNITGSYRALHTIVDFVLALSGNMNAFEQKEYERGCRIVYRTVGNKLILGWQFEKVDKPWKEFCHGFPPTIELIEQTILAFLKNAAYPENIFYDFDGTSERGFRCHNGVIDRKEFENDNDYFNSNIHDFYKIAIFEPFWNFYSK